MRQNVLSKRRLRWEALKVLYGAFVDEAHLTAHDALAPNMADLLSLPAFKALIEDDSGEGVDLVGWANLLPTLPDVIREHQSRIFAATNAAVLAAMEKVKESDVITSVDITTLLSPSATKSSQKFSCLKAFSFFKMSKVYLEDAVPFGNLLVKVRSEYRGRDEWLGEWREARSWAGELIECSGISMLVAIALLKDMGEAWKVKLMSQMTTLGAIFGCARCPTVEKRMAWVELVRNLFDLIPRSFVDLVRMFAGRPLRK